MSARPNDEARDRCSGAGQVEQESEHLDFALSGLGDQVPTRDRLRSAAKRLIVVAACWGFPASWAHELIQRGGLRDA